MKEMNIYYISNYMENFKVYLANKGLQVYESLVRANPRYQYDSSIKDTLTEHKFVIFLCGIEDCSEGTLLGTNNYTSFCHTGGEEITVDELLAYINGFISEFLPFEEVIMKTKESDPWMPGHYKGYYTLMSGKRIHMTIEGNIGKYCKRYRGNETPISTSYTRDSIFPG